MKTIENKTFCHECACWRPRAELTINAKTGEQGDFGECRFGAPAAESAWGTKNYYDRSLVLWSCWPVTNVNDFCFDGVKKVRVPGTEKK